MPWLRFDVSAIATSPISYLNRLHFSVLPQPDCSTRAPDRHSSYPARPSFPAGEAAIRSESNAPSPSVKQPAKPLCWTPIISQRLLEGYVRLRNPFLQARLHCAAPAKAVPFHPPRHLGY